MPNNLNTHHTQAIKQLANIFKAVAPKLQQQPANSEGEGYTEITRASEQAMIKNATEPTAPIAIANSPEHHKGSTRKNILMPAPIKDTKNAPPKGWTTSKEDALDMQIILQEDDDNNIGPSMVSGF